MYDYYYYYDDDFDDERKGTVESMAPLFRLLAGDELGYVRAFVSTKALSSKKVAAAANDFDDDSDDESLSLVGKFGALDREHRALKTRPVVYDAHHEHQPCACVVTRRGGRIEVMDAKSGASATEGETVRTRSDLLDAHGWMTMTNDDGGGLKIVSVYESGDVGTHAWDGSDRKWTERGTFKAAPNATSADANGALGKIVLGGKGQGADVVVWDIEQEKRTYKAKPPPVNWLGYRAPPWVSAACFAESSECVRFFVGTGEHRFRHYDTRADKRAVLDLDIGNGVITSVASSLDGQEAYVANARGLFEIVDLRAGKTRGRFKGNSGSIRQISVHPSGTHVACTGLDQYVRVYDVRTRKCVSTVFAKQPLTSVMFDARTLEYEAALAERAKAKAKKKTGKAKKRDDEYDDAYDDDDGEIVVKKKKTKTIMLTDDDGREIVKKLKKKKREKVSTDELEDATEKKKKKKKSKTASVHIE